MCGACRTPLLSAVCQNLGCRAIPSVQVEVDSQAFPEIKATVEIAGAEALGTVYPGVDVKGLYHAHPEALDAALAQQLTGTLHIDNTGKFQIVSYDFDLASVQALILADDVEQEPGDDGQVQQGAVDDVEDANTSEDDNAGHPLLDDAAVEGDLLSDEADL